MKAVEANFLTFLNDKQQLNIPIYQRTYSWLKEECLQLWADVFRAGRNVGTHTHFIGSIVYTAPATVTLATGTPPALSDGWATTSDDAHSAAGGLAQSATGRECFQTHYLSIELQVAAPILYVLAKSNCKK